MAWTAMLVVFTIEELSLSSILESFLQVDYQYGTVLPSAITFTHLKAETLP